MLVQLGPAVYVYNHYHYAAWYNVFCAASFVLCYVGINYIVMCYMDAGYTYGCYSFTVLLWDMKEW